ncbi:MAG: hypothetical protein AB1665_06185 [Candidatus Thermoplasmatota archaeon]
MISASQGIPIAACYRRIKALEHLNLVERAERILNQRGKWVQLYKSRIKEMDVKFEDGRIKVKINFKDGQVTDLSAFS